MTIAERAAKELRPYDGEVTLGEAVEFAESVDRESYARAVADVVAWLAIGPTCSVHSDHLAAAIQNGDARGWDDEWTRRCAERGVPKGSMAAKPYGGASVEDVIALAREMAANRPNTISCDMLNQLAINVERGKAKGAAERAKGGGNGNG
jgi:hypothetical protein